MTEEDIINVNEYVFGLDIGTRSIVGIVGYKRDNIFNIIGHHTIQHDTRAMIDGQIHNIEKVAEKVGYVKNELEKQVGFKLQNVCIAAAGRVLKTYEVHVEETMESNQVITKEHIHLLELMAIEKAHGLLNSELDSDDTVYHCVGYSVTKYYLNEYALSNLEGHKGKRIGVDLLATFLPQEVVDSLHTVINRCDLKVSNLTLEPIAAINVAIPEQYRLLNIALVDIGAGTSDIAITKDGSIIAYGMIPMAGDEITEQIVHKYLVDFKTAEMIKIKLNRSKIITFKDIMGISHKVDTEEILNLIEHTVDKLADKISKKIMELNGDKSTNAVFCVGGGGQLKNFTNLLAEKLNLANERVALRGAEVLDNISFINNSLKIPEMVTPVGICLCGLDKENSDFISIRVNGEEIKIFNNNNLTLVDVVAYKGFNHKNLICRRGNDIHYKLNGEDRKLRGEIGEPASIFVNGEVASLNHPINANDDIMLTVAKHGKTATLLIEDILQEFETFIIYINGNKITLPYKINVNNEVVNKGYIIKNNDIICIDAQYSVKDILHMQNIESDNANVYIGDVLKPQDYMVMKDDELLIDITNLNKGEIINEELINISNLESNISVDNDELKIFVNDKEIILRGKKTYIFVDIFDYIDFNLKNPEGKIVCLVNGRNASYMENINAGDRIEVYWNK